MKIDNSVVPYQHCSICAELGDYHRALQKGGHEEEDTYLPANSARLKLVRQINGHAYLHQCPECQTFYLYKTYYEFLVSGSEDEQILIRLKDETEAEKYADYWLR